MAEKNKQTNNGAQGTTHVEPRVPVGGPSHGTLRHTHKQAGRQSSALTEASS